MRNESKFLASYWAVKHFACIHAIQCFCGRFCYYTKRTAFMLKQKD